MNGFWAWFQYVEFIVFQNASMISNGTFAREAVMRADVVLKAGWFGLNLMPTNETTAARNGSHDPCSRSGKIPFLATRQPAWPVLLSSSHRQTSPFVLIGCT